VLLAGADKVSINSAAVRDPDLLNRASERFGTQCIVLAIDAKRQSDGWWEVYTHGGRRPTGIDAVQWAVQGVTAGAGEILLTSMDRDGTGRGFDIALTRAVTEAVNVPVIASGGAGNMAHFYEVFSESKADAALAATLFHDGILSVGELKRYLRGKELPIRMTDEGL
jgi:cyclase